MKSILIMVALLSAGNLWGQKEVVHQKQIWYKYSLKIPVNDQWQIRLEIDDRNFIDPGRQSQFIARTYLQRNLGKGWNAALGFACFVHSLPQEPEVQDFTNQTELRPSFEIANMTRLSEKFHLHHRYWTEFRFYNQPDEGFVFNNIRARYKLEAGYRLSEKFSFLAFEELFINLGSKITYNVFDQNRYGVACLYSPLKNIGFELMYINRFQQLPSGDLFYARDIIRIALHHTIPLGDQNKD